MLELRCPLPAFVLLDRETDKVLRGRATKGHGNHRQDVDEWLAVLPEVDELDADLGKVLDSIPHVVDHVLIDVLALRCSRDGAAGRLEETAVLAEYLAFRVAGQVRKGIRGIDDRAVGLIHVADDEGT